MQLIDLHRRWHTRPQLSRMILEFRRRVDIFPLKGVIDSWRKCTPGLCYISRRTVHSVVPLIQSPLTPLGHPHSTAGSATRGSADGPLRRDSDRSTTRPGPKTVYVWDMLLLLLPRATRVVPNSISTAWRHRERVSRVASVLKLKNILIYSTAFHMYSNCSLCEVSCAI